MEAAVRFAVERQLPNRWLVGWSFGTELALMYGAVEPVAGQVEGAVLLSPPLHRATDAHLGCGRRAASRWRCWCPNTTTTCGPRPPPNGSAWCRRPAS